MTANSLLNWSSHSLLISFIGYLLATALFAGTVRSRSAAVKWNDRKLTAAAYISLLLALLIHCFYFVLRWIAIGHAPVSNLFEFMVFFAMMLAAVLLFFYLVYPYPLLAVTALFIIILLLAFAGMLPSEAAPLVPSLQSHWLSIHVTTAALGEAILSVSFFAGFLYILKETNQQRLALATLIIEVLICCMLSVVGYTAVTVGFHATDYQTVFTDPEGAETVYHLPALLYPHETQLTEGSNFKAAAAPVWLRGEDAALHINTFIWSVAAGLVFYILIRLLIRKRIGAVLQRAVKRLPADQLDDISYRAVAIGFPIFTLGALIFAMIWAQQAWDRFWGWDPKEVWALITWLFYAAFLHIRMQRGWQGIRSAWLSVIGFSIIMFNLLAVNLLLAGLHSYA